MANDQNYKFESWCMKAIEKIRFTPDQDAVMRELYDHMMDHYEALLEQGLDRAEAERKTLEAMGSAEELAPQLAAVHHPFWGWCLWVSRIALALLLCGAIFVGIPYFRYLYFSEPTYERLHVYEDTYISDEVGVSERLFYAEPDLSAASDGYTLTLTRAARWTTDFIDESLTDQDSLFFQIRVFNPRPWAERPEFSQWLWAEDSLGNYYYSREETVNYPGECYLMGNIYHSAPFTYTLDLQTSGFLSADAQWIDIHYDRAGRDIVFRIDLTGGDAA